MSATSSANKLSMERRTFLIGSFAAAGLALAGCSSTQKTSELTASEPDGGDNVENPVDATAETSHPTPVMEAEGEWIPVTCWTDCGGQRCVNRVKVVNGNLIRQRTDDSGEDTFDNPQLRACGRGRSLRWQMTSADRIKYPMKRKHWEPLTGGQKELRGADEWERISWDEALDYVAAELENAKANYGNNSIYVASRWWDTHGGEIPQMLNYWGGNTASWSTNSAGTFELANRALGYSQTTTVGSGGSAISINDRMDMRNCETIVLLSMNPAMSSAGNAIRHYVACKNEGTKFICVDPRYTETCAVLDGEWVPVRPGTDVALLLGVAYAMLSDDSESDPLIDWDFLDRCTIGFDAGHMPEGEDAQGNFKDYVLGTYDGTPKTPEWASAICGTPAEQITWLAHEIGMQKKVGIASAWAAARNHNSDGYPMALLTVGAMGGHIGKSGHFTGISAHQGAANTGSALVKAGGKGLPTIEVEGPVADDCIHDGVLWKTIAESPTTYHYSGKATHMPTQTGEERPIDIHIIYHAGRALFQNRPDTSEAIKAHRKVDFVVAHSQFMRPEAQYADIILPINTEWERPGFVRAGARGGIVCGCQAIEQFFEAKSDQWVAKELGARLGVDTKALYPISEKQQFFNQIAGSAVIKDDGSDFEPLVTITQDDLDAWGVDGTPQEGRISLADFTSQGFYRLGRKEGDAFGQIAYGKYREDPEANAMKSDSGKIEIFCAKYRDTGNAMGWGTVAPIAQYVPAVEGFEESQSGSYPFQLITPHTIATSHAIWGNDRRIAEAFSGNVMLSAEDAKKVGVTDGDVVALFNDNGRIVRHVTVTNKIIPGVVAMPHGTNWVDFDDKTGIDMGGSENFLTPSVYTGQGISGYNSVLVQIEKAPDVDLVETAYKPLKTVEA